MDELKKYLSENRKTLDADVPDLRVWESVNLRTKKKVHGFTWTRMAVAASLIAGVLFVLFYLNRNNIQPPIATNKNNDQQVLPGKQQIKNLPAIPGNEQPNDVSERKQVDKKNTVQIAQNAAIKYKTIKGAETSEQAPTSFDADVTTLLESQLSNLKRLPVYTESEKYFAVYKEQWKELEQREALLKKSFKNEADDVVVSAMIRLYKQKLQLLSDLQFEIKDMNAKAEVLGKDSTTKPYYFTL